VTYENLLLQLNSSYRESGLSGRVVYDSRKVRNGDLFVCIKGFKTDAMIMSARLWNLVLL